MTDFLLGLLALQRWQRMVKRTISAAIRELTKKKGYAAQDEVLAIVLRRRRKDGRTEEEIAQAVTDWFARARFGWGGRYRGAA